VEPVLPYQLRRKWKKIGLNFYQNVHYCLGYKILWREKVFTNLSYWLTIYLFQFFWMVQHDERMLPWRLRERCWLLKNSTTNNQNFCSGEKSSMELKKQFPFTPLLRLHSHQQTSPPTTPQSAQPRTPLLSSIMWSIQVQHLLPTFHWPRDWGLAPVLSDFGAKNAPFLWTDTWPKNNQFPCFDADFCAFRGAESESTDLGTTMNDKKTVVLLFSW